MIFHAVEQQGHCSCCGQLDAIFRGELHMKNDKIFLVGVLFWELTQTVDINIHFEQWEYRNVLGFLSFGKGDLQT